MKTIKIKLNNKMLYAPFVYNHLHNAWKTGYWLMKAIGRTDVVYITVDQVKEYRIYDHKLSEFATVRTNLKKGEFDIELERMSDYNKVGEPTLITVVRNKVTDKGDLFAYDH